MDNPLKWIEDFSKYVISPTAENFYYGDFCLVSESIPQSAYSSYKKYIKLISKVLLSWDSIIFDNNEITRIGKGSTEKEQEQLSIVEELLNKGLIPRKF